MVNLIYSLNGTHLFPNLTFLWFLSMKMAKTLKSVLQYCILDFHVDHFWLKNHLLNLKGNKDIDQIWMKPVFHVETQITFLALKTTKCCLNQHLQTKPLQYCTKGCTICTTCTILYNVVHKLYNIVQKVVLHKQLEKLYNWKMGLIKKLYKVFYNIVQIVQDCTIIYVLLYNSLYNNSWNSVQLYF